MPMYIKTIITMTFIRSITIYIIYSLVKKLPSFAIFCIFPISPSVNPFFLEFNLVHYPAVSDNG